MQHQERTQGNTLQTALSMQSAPKPTKTTPAMHGRHSTIRYIDSECIPFLVTEGRRTMACDLCSRRQHWAEVKQWLPQLYSCDEACRAKLPIH
jgi:hypothetical protein